MTRMAAGLRKARLTLRVYASHAPKRIDLDLQFGGLAPSDVGSFSFPAESAQCAHATPECAGGASLGAPHAQPCRAGAVPASPVHALTPDSRAGVDGARHR